MLDLNTLMLKQEEGEKLLSGLTPQEKTILSSFCWLSGNGLLTTASKKKASVNEVVMNAYRRGIALGITLSVQNSEVKVR